MSIFKKICSLLFEETETEIIADDDLETISFKDVKQYEQEKMETQPEVKEHIEKTAPQIVKPEAKQKAEPSQVINNKPKFVSIDIEKKQKAAIRKEPVKTKLKKNEVKDFEFTPVISPMFGSKEEEALKKKTLKKEQAAVHKHTKKPNPLGTVISPFYGMDDEVEEHMPEDKHLETVTSVIEQPSSVDEKNSVPSTMEMEENSNSLSLDDMLAADHEDDEDDVLQISLFGETKSVNTQDTQSLKINMEE